MPKSESNKSLEFFRIKILDKALDSDDIQRAINTLRYVTSEDVINKYAKIVLELDVQYSRSLSLRLNNFICIVNRNNLKIDNKIKEEFLLELVKRANDAEKYSHVEIKNYKEALVVVCSMQFYDSSRAGTLYALAHLPQDVKDAVTIGDTVSTLLIRSKECLLKMAAAKIESAGLDKAANPDSGISWRSSALKDKDPTPVKNIEEAVKKLSNNGSALRRQLRRFFSNKSVTNSALKEPLLPEGLDKTKPSELLSAAAAESQGYKKDGASREAWS